jgi:hypothetical protein
MKIDGCQSWILLKNVHWTSLTTLAAIYGLTERSAQIRLAKGGERFLAIHNRQG